MGLNDAREQLEVCKAESVKLEQQLATALRSLERSAREAADLRALLRRQDERLLTEDEALVAGRSCRHSAAIIRIVLEQGGEPAPEAIEALPMLDALAARLYPEEQTAS